MRKNKVLRLLNVLLLYAFVLVLLFLFKSLWLSHESRIFSKYPDKADFVMKINGSSLLKNIIYSTVMESRDEELIQLIDQAIHKKRKKSGKNENIGVDWLNDFLFFQSTWDGHTVQGISAVLDQPRLLTENWQNFNKGRSVYAFSDNMVVILTVTGNDYFNRSALRKLAMSVLHKKVNEKDRVENQELLRFKSKRGLFQTGSLLKSAELSVEQQLKGILFSGDVEVSAPLDSRNKEASSLFPNGFFIQSYIISNKLKEWLQKHWKTAGIDLPKISGFGLNYRGVDIQNGDSGLQISPDFDLLVRFDTSFGGEQQLMERLMASKEFRSFGYKIQDDQLKNETFGYRIHQVDSLTFVISNALEKVKMVPLGRNVLQIKGRPMDLLSMKGDPFLIGFIRMLQSYKSAYQFFDQSDYVELTLRQIGENKLYLNGRYRFKPAAYPLNETLKLALQNNWIRIN